MEMRGLLLASCIGVTACASAGEFDKEGISDVYVKDFHSSEPAACRPADVPLGHGEAHAFFQRAKSMDYKTMTDNYPVAPCYIEGTLKYKGDACDWKIFAGHTGSIKCRNRQEQYFACDICKDLFKP